jgi:hypothetical protein
MSKPDFTGRWKYNPSKSVLRIPPPESTSLVIEHREPHFRLSRTLVVGGSSDTFSIELTTDGREVVQERDDLQICARLYWEGETLVFESVLTGDEEQATNVVRYTLAEQGETFVARERFSSERQSYENLWVLDRQQSA